MTSDLKNPLNLSQGTLESLKRTLQLFGELDSEFPDRLLRYLVDGEDEAVVEAAVSAAHQQAYQSQRCQQQFVAVYQQTPYSTVQTSSIARPFLSRLTSRNSNENPLRRILSSTAITDVGFHCRLVYLWSNFSVGAIYRSLMSGQLSPQTHLLPLKECLPEFIEMVASHKHRGRKTACGVTAETVDAMFVQAGEPVGALGRLVYMIDPNDYRQSQLALHGMHLDEFVNYTLQHAWIVQEALQQPERNGRIHALQILAKVEAPPAPFLEAIAELAVSSAKTEREPAATLLEQDLQAAMPLLKAKAESGSSSERQQAIKLLWNLDKEASQPFLESRLEVETAAKVRSTIEQLITPPTPVSTDAPSLTLPPLPKIDFDAPLPESALDICRQIEDEYHQALQRIRQQLNFQASHTSAMTTEPKSSVLFEVLQRGTLTDCYKQQHLFRDYPSNSPISKSVKALLQLTEFRLIHAVRLMIAMSCLSEGEYKVDFNKYLFKDEGHELLLFYHRHHPESNLRALANVFELLKLPKDQMRIEVSGRFHASTEEGWRCFLESLNLAPERIGTEMLHDQQNRGFWRWDSEAIWPYFAEHVHRIKDSIAIKIDTNWWQRYESRGLRKNGIRVLKTFPQPPAQLVSTLWDLALEGSKDERVIAQKCLNTLEGTQARLLTTLFDPNRDMRIVAADWLGDSADKTVIAPLKQALQQEKSEAAKDTMLRSLERLGASMDEFLGREHLLKECQQLLRKGIPRTISWFPFADIPPVYWSDTGEAVDSDILKGLILKCFNQKKSEPGPILRRYVAMWQPDGREALGQFVLENGIASTKEKGILAIAAACCGKDAVPPIKTYLKTWYGQRAVQCKTLLQLLTWIDDNSATQLLISVSDRFRTRGIQKEAEKLVNELAKRNGWSPDELSDRTIPTAGFDQGVEQTLNYGSRQFTLLLDANMSLVLKNPDGKVIKSLPTARKDDDADLVKAAKKQLSDSRKQLKQVLTMQQARLYEAMCTQRAWRFPDWDLYLNQHPIVGRYCQQLVWAIYDGDTLVQTLRPLEDRTFTNAEDEEVTPPPEAIIRLAHSCIIPFELTTAWQTHFADYGVMPLLQQFRASTYVLPEAQRRDTRLTDFDGYLIQAFQLRGLASKRGYTRGHAQDGGCFYDYRKAFSSLGIEAVIEFSGNSLPGEDRTVALTYLSFCRLPEETDAGYFYNPAQLPLEEVPPVLLSETWNDLQAISAQGSGYDPDWQKKVEY